MREVLHSFIVLSILPILLILPITAIIIYWKSKIISTNLKLNIFKGIFILIFIYFFLFLEFKSRMDDSINGIIITDYSSKKLSFDYGEEKNIKYYEYQSSDSNASLKSSIVSWSTWILFISSYSITIFYSRKRV